VNERRGTNIWIEYRSDTWLHHYSIRVYISQSPYFLRPYYYTLYNSISRQWRWRRRSLVSESPDCGLRSVRQMNDDNSNDQSPHLMPSLESGRCGGSNGNSDKGSSGGSGGDGMGQRRLRRSAVRDGVHDTLQPWLMSRSERRFGSTRERLHTVRREESRDGDNRRIIGSDEADVGEHTWQVAIALDGVFFCGGALIADRFVITAAHCVMT